MKIDKDYDGCIEILIFRKLKVYTYSLKSDDDESDEDDDDENGIELKKLYGLAKPCFDDFKKFLHECLNAISINRVENHLIIGFSNFAKTGEYIGYIWAVFAMINSSLPNTYLRAEPSFAGQIMNIKGFLNIDISLLKLIIPAIKLISKKEVRTLIGGIING